MGNQFKKEYELEDRIGNGSLGSVYSCRDKTDGKQYAVRIINLKDEKRV